VPEAPVRGHGSRYSFQGAAKPRRLSPGWPSHGRGDPTTTVDPNTRLTRFSGEARRVLERFVARVAELRASRFLVESADPLTLKLDFFGGKSSPRRTWPAGGARGHWSVPRTLRTSGAISAVMVSSLIGRTRTPGNAAAMFASRRSPRRRRLRPIRFVTAVAVASARVYLEHGGRSSR
jgi:hypothetical protein